MQKVYNLLQILVKWLVKWTKEITRDLNIFDKNQEQTCNRNFLGEGIFLGLNIHQTFHLLNKKVQKKFQEFFLSTEWVTLKSFIR